MQITLRQLEIFAAIYQEGTVTRAARRIGLSQAATSQALAELENQLQRRLFDRNGRRIVWNAAGRELLPAAIQVLDRVRDIEAGAGYRPLSIKLCASLTVGNYMLPSLIARFTRRHWDALFIWLLEIRTTWLHRCGSSKATRVGLRASPVILTSRRFPVARINL